MAAGGGNAGVKGVKWGLTLLREVAVVLQGRFRCWGTPGSLLPQGGCQEGIGVLLAGRRGSHAGRKLQPWGFGARGVLWGGRGRH